jgi:alpha-methylacyl-CoA racemase
VLDWDEAPQHPHNQARKTYLDLNGVMQPAPAPRFERTPSATPHEATAGSVNAVLARWAA